MKSIQIENRTLSLGEPTFVVAEIGVNHDGSLQRALQLVDHAAQCGADAVKLQVFRADRLMHESSSFAAYQKERCAEANPIEMLRRYELQPAELARVVAAIRRREMIPLATPFSPAEVDVIEQLGLGAVKIASPDLVNRPLLERVARLGKPMLVSTGAATMDEVEQAVGWFRSWSAEFLLLHCVSSYPTPAAEANLCWVAELSQRFDVPVGYSDHTTEAISGALAVSAGAVLIEKHLTYNRGAIGPDHAASADPHLFSHYIRFIRQAECLRGMPGKNVLAIEQDVRKVSRQSLVLQRDLNPGEALCEQDLTVQRPGTGIPAAMIEQTLGRKPRHPLRAGTMLQWDMLEAA